MTSHPCNKYEQIMLFNLLSVNYKRSFTKYFDDQAVVVILFYTRDIKRNDRRNCGQAVETVIFMSHTTRLL